MSKEIVGPDDLSVNPYIKHILIEKLDIKEFYPPQSSVFEDSEILEGRNILIKMETAAGKTLIAEIAMMEEILEGEEGSKIVYTTPLKALAREKYDEFNEHWGKKAKIIMLTGDVGGEGVAFDIREGNKANIIITTNEKLDSLIRRNIIWLQKVSILVVDEIHNVISENRGPTIEVVIAKLRQLRKDKIQIIGLSATLGNAEELAEWLDGELVPIGTYKQTRIYPDPKTKKRKQLTVEHPLSLWRPVNLIKGIYDAEKGVIYWIDKDLGIIAPEPIEKRLYHERVTTTTELKHNAIVSLTVQGITPKKGEEVKQVLVFTSTRKSAESTALMLAGKKTARKRTGYIVPFLKTTEKRELANLSDQILKGYEWNSSKTKKLYRYTPSNKDKNLAKMIERGAAYHHAGLRAVQRRLIEQGFRDKIIKVICATPTLAAGVNLPAKTVILATHQRYVGGTIKYANLPKYEVVQMLGRAGRPRLDNIGEGILIATDEQMFNTLKTLYIFGEIENIESHLGEETHLRKHLLAFISARRQKIREEVSPVEWVPREDIETFILNTFYGFQTKSVLKIQKIVNKIFDFYIENDLIEYDEEADSFLITKFGKRTVELYVDPLSSVMIKQGIEILAQYPKDKSPYTALSWLNLLAYSPDITLVNAVGNRQADRDLLFGFIKTELAGQKFFSVTAKRQIFEKENPIPPEGEYEHFDFYTKRMQDFLSALKLTKIMTDWIHEIREDDILAMYGSGKVNPGDIFRYKEIYDWLLFASSEIARLLGYSDKQKAFTSLRLRVESGIRPDILELVEIKDIGRVLGRRIFTYLLKKKIGNKSNKLGRDLTQKEEREIRKTLAKTAKRELAKLSEDELIWNIKGIGPDIAKKIKQQLETEIGKDITPKLFEKE